ncbi:hypothetical protein CP533_1012, partial [Ophiocordyceps camponoti-saundersi (nom. inval.)]
GRQLGKQTTTCRKLFSIEFHADRVLLPLAHTRLKPLCLLPQPYCYRLETRSAVNDLHIPTLVDFIQLFLNKTKPSSPQPPASISCFTPHTSAMSPTSPSYQMPRDHHNPHNPHNHHHRVPLPIFTLPTNPALHLAAQPHPRPGFHSAPNQPPSRNPLLYRESAMPQIQLRCQVTEQEQVAAATAAAAAAAAAAASSVPPPDHATTSSSSATNPNKQSRTSSSGRQQSSIAARSIALELWNRGATTGEITQRTGIKRDAFNSLLRRAKARGFVRGHKVIQEFVMDAQRTGRPRTRNVNNSSSNNNNNSNNSSNHANHNTNQHVQ